MLRAGPMMAVCLLKKSPSGLQTSGEALYTSDIGLGGSGLHAVPVLSSQALARLEHVDPSKALKVINVRSPALSLLARQMQHCWSQSL